MFIFVLCLMWTISAITILADPKSATNRWIGLTSFAAGIGIFHPLIQEMIIPYLQTQHFHNTSIIHWIQISATFFSAMSYYFVPYCFLRYGLAFSDYLKLKWTKNKLRLTNHPLNPHCYHVSIISIRYHW